MRRGRSGGRSGCSQLAYCQYQEVRMRMSWHMAESLPASSASRCAVPLIVVIGELVQRSVLQCYYRHYSVDTIERKEGVLWSVTLHLFIYNAELLARAPEIRSFSTPTLLPSLHVAVYIVRCRPSFIWTIMRVMVGSWSVRDRDHGLYETRISDLLLLSI